MILALAFKDTTGRPTPVMTTAWSVQALDPQRVLISFINNGAWRTETVSMSMDEFERRVVASKLVIDLR